MSREVRLADVERALAELSPQELPGFLGELEKLRAAAWARLTAEAANGQSRRPEQGDYLLDVKEASALLGISPDALYRKEWPFKVRIEGRVLFSAQGIERYIAQRRGR